MNAPVKREIVDQRLRSGNDIVSSNSSNSPTKRDNPAMVIHLSSSSSSSSTSSSDSGSGTSPDKGRVGRSRNVDVVLGKKRMRESSEEEGTAVLPPGFLSAKGKSKAIQASKQFWKAGDFDGDSVTDAPPSAGGIDHVRIHPKFLHSNATSHKWALGAFAELLDNSLDEVCNGATFVSINVADNTKDQSKMLLIEDDGGGMDPDKMRQCMSLGYSMKSKMANTIGQYGNGFKTSTMRLGADVIVFSRCCGKDGKIRTQSIGLLSYTFLRSTKQADIIVPMLDYEKIGGQWAKILWSSSDDWDRNLRTIVEWSPFSSEMDLLCQFNLMKMHGTRVIIYNLWEDGEGQLELDFDADPHDIQLRGVNRDEKNIQMAKTYPNSKHFLTYRHSLRSYASILYLRLPPGFRVILRGCDVEHHNVVNDMMLTQKITYRPMSCPDGSSKDSMTAVVTIGFVKDAKHHIDVQGFNVYHKNRLIKPFWRLWNAAGSDGRGVIGVLEANFVEPAHDKQGFERTTVLGRLESKLIQMQKTYWRTHCHFVGYSKRSNKTSATSFADREDSTDYSLQEPQSRNKYKSHSTLKEGLPNKPKKSTPKRSVMTKQSPEVLPVPEAASDNDLQNTPEINVDGCRMPGRRPLQRAAGSISSKGYNNTGKESVNSDINDAVTVENSELQGRLEKNEKEIQSDLLKDLLYERDRCKELEAQLLEAQQKIEELNKEQESLIDIFSEERQRRDKVEESLRKKLKESSDMIQDLLGKINTLEGKKGST